MEKANSSGIIRGPFLGFVMAFADVFRRERPFSSWSSCISLAKNFCRMLSSAPSSLSINWIWSGGGERQPGPAVLSLADAKETPPAPGIVTPLPFSQGFRASQPLSPFPRTSAACCQLGSAPEQAEQNPDLILTEKSLRADCFISGKNDRGGGQPLPPGWPLPSQQDLWKSLQGQPSSLRFHTEGNVTGQCHYLKGSHFFPQFCQFLLCPFLGFTDNYWPVASCFVTNRCSWDFSRDWSSNGYL